MEVQRERHSGCLYDPDWLWVCFASTWPLCCCATIVLAMLLHELEPWGLMLACIMMPIGVGSLMAVAGSIRACIGSKILKKRSLEEEFADVLAGDDRMYCEGHEIELFRLARAIKNGSGHARATAYTNRIFDSVYHITILLGIIDIVGLDVPAELVVLILASTIVANIVWWLVLAPSYEVEPGCLRIQAGGLLGCSAAEPVSIQLQDAHIACSFPEGHIDIRAEDGSLTRVPLKGIAWKHAFVCEVLVSATLRNERSPEAAYQTLL